MNHATRNRPKASFVAPIIIKKSVHAHACAMRSHGMPQHFVLSRSSVPLIVFRRSIERLTQNSWTSSWTRVVDTCRSYDGIISCHSACVDYVRQCSHWHQQQSETLASRTNRRRVQKQALRSSARPVITQATFVYHDCGI